MAKIEKRADGFYIVGIKPDPKVNPYKTFTEAGPYATEQKAKDAAITLKESISNSFQNGRTKALQAITNKAMAVGVKLENWNGQDINLSTGKKITHKRAENGSWDSSPSMSEEEYKEYIQKRKQIK